MLINVIIFLQYIEKYIYNLIPINRKCMELSSLKLNKYNGCIVFEYDVYACYGDNLKDKIISYCHSIDDVSERLNYI